MASGLIKVIVLFFRFILELILDIILTALLIASFAAFWRIPWIFLEPPEGGINAAFCESRKHYRINCLAAFGSSLLDLITLPMFFVVSCTWRGPKMWFDVWRSDSDRFYSADKRYSVIIPFFFLLADIPLMIMGAATHAMIWRVPFYWVDAVKLKRPYFLNFNSCSSSVSAPGSSVQDGLHRYEGDHRRNIGFHFINGLVEILLLPAGLPVLLTVYRVKPLMEDWNGVKGDKPQDFLKRKAMVLKHFGLLLLDIPFFILAFLALCLLWRAPKMMTDIFSNAKTAKERRRMAAEHFIFSIRDVLILPLIIPLLVTVYRGIFVLKYLWDATSPWADDTPKIDVTSCTIELPERGTGLIIHVLGTKASDFILREGTPVKLYIRNSKPFWKAIGQGFGGSIASVGQAMLPFSLTPRFLDVSQFKSGSTDGSFNIDLNTHYATKTIVNNIKKLQDSDRAVIQVEFGNHAGTLINLDLAMGGEFERMCVHSHQAKSLKTIDADAIFGAPVTSRSSAWGSPTAGSAPSAVSSSPSSSPSPRDLQAQNEKKGQWLCDVYWKTVLLEFFWFLADIAGLVLFVLLHLFPHRIYRVYSTGCEGSERKKARDLVALIEKTISVLVGRVSATEKAMHQIDATLKGALAADDRRQNRNRSPPFCCDEFGNYGYDIKSVVESNRSGTNRRIQYYNLWVFGAFQPIAVETPSSVKSYIESCTVLVTKLLEKADQQKQQQQSSAVSTSDTEPPLSMKAATALQDSISSFIASMLGYKVLLGMSASVTSATSNEDILGDLFKHRDLFRESSGGDSQQSIATMFSNNSAALSAATASVARARGIPTTKTTGATTKTEGSGKVKNAPFAGDDSAKRTLRRRKRSVDDASFGSSSFTSERSGSGEREQEPNRHASLNEGSNLFTPGGNNNNSSLGHGATTSSETAFSSNVATTNAGSVGNLLPTDATSANDGLLTYEEMLQAAINASLQPPSNQGETNTEGAESRSTGAGPSALMLNDVTFTSAALTGAAETMSSSRGVGLLSKSQQELAKSAAIGSPQCLLEQVRADQDAAKATMEKLFQAAEEDLAKTKWTGGKEGWGGLRGTIFKETLQLFLDIAAVLSFLICLCSVYRAYTCISSVAKATRKTEKRRAAIWCLAEIGIDLLYVFKFAACLLGIRGIVTLPADLLIYIFKKPSYVVARQVIDYHFTVLLEDLLKILSLIFAWDTLRICVATIVFGLFSPGVMLEGAFSKWDTDPVTGRPDISEKSFLRAALLLIFSCAWMFGLPFFLAYYVHKESFTAVYALYFGVLGFVLWLGVAVSAYYRDHRIVSYRRSAIRFIQPSWHNLLTFFTILVEGVQLLAIAFSVCDKTVFEDPAIGEALSEASRYVYLIFGQEWAIGGLPFGTYFSLTAALFFFILSAMPIVVGDMLHWTKSSEEIIISPLWIALNQFLGQTCLFTILRNTALTLVCEADTNTVLYSPEAECWSGRHRGIAVASMISLIYFVPSALMRNLKVDETVCRSLDVVYAQLYRLLTNAASATAVVLTLLSHGDKSFVLSVLLIVSLWNIFWTVFYGKIFNPGNPDTGEGPGSCSVASVESYRLVLHLVVLGTTIFMFVVVGQADGGNDKASLWPLYTIIAIAACGILAAVVRGCYLRHTKSRNESEDSIDEVRRVLLELEASLTRAGAINQTRWKYMRSQWRANVKSATRVSPMALYLKQLEANTFTVFLSPLFLNTNSYWTWKVAKLIDEVDLAREIDVQYELDGPDWVEMIICCRCGCDSHLDDSFEDDKGDPCLSEAERTFTLVENMLAFRNATASATQRSTTTEQR